MTEEYILDKILETELKPRFWTSGQLCLMLIGTTNTANELSKNGFYLQMRKVNSKTYKQKEFFKKQIIRNREKLGKIVKMAEEIANELERRDIDVEDV